MGYNPELDISPVLEPNTASYFQMFISILWWIIKLGKIDIITNVSSLLSHVALLRGRHLITAVCNGPEKDHNIFKKCDWLEFYSDAKEAIPMNAPEPQGKEINTHMFVVSDNARKRYHRWKGGFLIHVNIAFLQWSSKKHSTVKTSVFGAEFVTMKQGIDAPRGLRYKPKITGIPTSVPLYIYLDNMSVVYNTSRPESVLRKKHNYVSCH